MIKIINKTISAILLLCFLTFNLQNTAFSAPYWEALGVRVPSETLRKIATLNGNKRENAQLMTEIFLEQMGYPKNLVKIVFYEKGASGLGKDIEGGHFNFSSGQLSLNTAFCDKVDVGTLAAVIRHELDHFQKSAQLCKAIGIEKYEEIWKGSADEKSFNKGFWQKAIKYTDINGFNAKKYLSGIVKYSSTIDFSSKYYILVELTDGRRNPFEITAYAYTDLINDYFGNTKVADTSLHNLATAFNEVDWAVYNISQTYPALKRSRTAIFDYFYMKTLIALNPYLYEVYKKALNGADISYFWKNAPNIFEDFEKGRATVSSVDNLIYFLDIMTKNMRQRLSEKDVQNIFRLKFLTLKYEMSKPENADLKGNFIILLKNNIDDYFTFLNSRGLNDDNFELLMLIEKFKINNTKIYVADGQFMTIGGFWNYFKIIGDIISNRTFKEELKRRELGDNIFGWIKLFQLIGAKK